MKQFKDNDVIYWDYSEEYKAELASKYGKDSYPYRTRITDHCLDKIIIFNSEDNNLQKDTYWGTQATRINIDSYKFTFKVQGNLDDCIELDKAKYDLEVKKYSYDSFIVLNIHNGYRCRYFIKKDAKEDLDTKIENTLADINRVKAEIIWQESRLKELENTLKALRKEN